MKQLFITAIFLLLPIWSTEIEFFMSDEFIQWIHNSQTDWTAERYFNPNLTLDSLKRLTGIIINKEVNNSEVRMARIKSFENSTIPEFFDARDNWPFCKNVINEIRNQGFCASSWAFSAAQVVADRTCIQSNDSIKFQYAPGDLVYCCDSCGECEGIENITDVWEFLQNTGVVSGGDYQERYVRKTASKPHSKSSFNEGAITCNKSCQVSKQMNNELDKKCIESYDTIIADIQEIQEEIMTNGPVQAVFDVYADFLHYKSGVYYHLSSILPFLPLIGKHAVKILGWGEENGKNYWLAANSWGQGWGDQGTFKILRGKRECGIENNIIWPKVETIATTTHSPTTISTSTTTTTQSTTPIKTTTTTMTAPTTPASNTTKTVSTTTPTNITTAPTSPTSNTTTTPATTTTTTTEKTTSTTPSHSGAINVKHFTCRFLTFSSLLYLL